MYRKLIVSNGFKLGENARDSSVWSHCHGVLLGPGLFLVLWILLGLHRELHGLLVPPRSSSWDPRPATDSPEKVFMLIC